MASNRIKGLTVEIGGDTTKLGKALADADKKTRSLSGELRQIDKLLKLDPGNVDLLAQKQTVLAEAVEETRNKLDTLKEAERQVQAQFQRGEASADQVRALQREIIATTNQLEKFEQAAKETQDAIEGVEKGADGAADDIHDVADAEKRAADEGASLGGVLKGGLKAGLAVVATAATAAVGALVACAESSREYRTEMGKLDTAFESSGHSADTAQAAYEELQSVIGETDQSVEAAQQIALLAESEEEVARWSEIAAGVVGTFGDALQPETFYEAANETAKLGEATGAYVQMLEGTGRDVEAFNKGLAKCKTTAEKQNYVLEYTEEILGDAADAYRENNKEVIAANKANEKWNASLAKVGKTIDPFISEAKEWGAAVLEDMAEPLESVAAFVTREVLPALGDFARWISQNIPLIVSGTAAVASGLAAYRLAAYNATLATQGYTLATKAAEVAQKAFNLVQAATPWALIGIAVGGVVGALTYFATATDDAAEKVDILTEEERELIDALDEEVEAYRRQKEARDEAMASVGAEMGHITGLANELSRMADESGRVAENDQARAQFILNELNEALGTEYSMTGNVINQYQRLQDEIYQLIEAKKAQMLLEEMQTSYVEAIKGEAAAWDTVVAAEKDYIHQKQLTKSAEEEYLAFKQEYEEKRANARTAADERELQSDAVKLGGLLQNWEDEKGILAEKEGAYNEAAEIHGGYSATIKQYEDASVAVLEENYKRAEEILLDKNGVYADHADTVSKETAEVLRTLENEATEAGYNAEMTRNNFERGVEGYTQEMVDEAYEAYDEAFEAYAKAYNDAYGVAGNLGDGLNEGLAAKRNSILNTARNLVDSVFKIWNKTAQIKSPSRVAKKIFGYVGAGAVIGLEEETDDLIDTAEKQMDALMDTYHDRDAQQSLRTVTAQAARNQAQQAQTAATDHSSMLTKILAAIEAGQVIQLDGDKVVGGTVNRMDRQLGYQRELVEMGAK